MIDGLFGVGLVSLATFGYGLIWLKIFKFDDSTHVTETLATAFALGLGTIGWIIFFPGIYAVLKIETLIAVMIPGWIGNILIFRYVYPIRLARLSWKVCFPIVGLLFFITLGFLEATTPPVDADSLAYHFALPKLFWSSGAIEFVPMAVQGAIPLLSHVLYLAVFAFGGEMGLTLWAFVTEMVMGLAIYGIGRRWLPNHWSLVLVLVFFSVPAVVFSGGTGQLEVKTALFMLIGVVAASDGIKRKQYSKIIIAGLMMGFFVGSKYLGLFAVVSLCFVIARHKKWFRSLLIFSVVVCLSGSQWYLWNWWHSGMPIFPTLFSVLNLQDSAHWNTQIDLYFREIASNSFCFERNAIGFITYPFITVLSPEACMGAARTGLGPFLWILFPGVLVSLFLARKAWRHSSLLNMAIPAFAYYSLWFLIPTLAMESRQLLPIYPIALMVGTVAVLNGLRGDKGMLLMSLASVSTIFLGIVIHIIFSMNHFQYYSKRESRDDYLMRNVGNYGAVQWVNANLSEEHRLANPIRYINYVLDVPYLYINEHAQTQLEIYPGASYEKFLAQLRKNNLTHILVSQAFLESIPEEHPKNVIGKFLSSEHANHVVSIDAMRYTSRTLKRGYLNPVSIFEIKFTDQ